MCTSDTDVPFLDITVKVSEGKITTDIYYKETDTHNYVPFDSCHPRHTKTNIPYALARRICTIVDQDETRDKKLDGLKVFLKESILPI